MNYTACFNTLKQFFLLLPIAMPLVLGAGVLHAAEAGITRVQYEDYLARFNANDPSFIEYYHPDVVLELPGAEIIGDQGIRDFYAEVKKYIKETVEVTTYITDGKQLAVEIPTTFEVIADWDDSFWGVPLKKGQVMRTISWGIYDIEDGKFRRIRTARYQMINDWQYE